MLVVGENTDAGAGMVVGAMKRTSLRYFQTYPLIAAVYISEPCVMVFAHKVVGRHCYGRILGTDGVG